MGFTRQIEEKILYMSASDFKKILIRDLKTWCEQNNINPIGTKKVLIARIKRHKSTLDKFRKELCIKKTTAAKTHKMDQQNDDGTGKFLPTKTMCGEDNNSRGANFNENFQPPTDDDIYDGATGGGENKKN